MFRLYDRLPRSVWVGETEYGLDLAFDNVLLAFSALKDPELTSSDKLEVFLTVLLAKGAKALPEKDLWERLFDAISKVLRLEDSTAVQRDLNGDPIKGGDKPPDFDFDYDAQSIYAAFWQVYNLDLIAQQGKLHWHSFLALLTGLPSDTEFTRIREIRTTKLSDVKDKDQRRKMVKLKRQVALPNQAEEEGSDEYGG